MAEENPSGTPTPGTVPKKETVRITLPSKPGDATGVKRETVRLSSITPPPPAPAAPVTEPAYDNSLKGQTIRITPMSATPKKETTRVATAPIKPAPPAAPSSVPPMPAPPAFNAPAPLGPPKPLPPSGSLPAVKPVAPSGMPPKPPGLAPKPSVPAMPPAPVAAPLAPAVGAVPSAAAVPTGLKAAPKKETARIQVAPTGGPTMPKATVKMAQTQPMIAAVPAMPKKSEALAVAANDEPQGSDVGLIILSLVAVLSSGAAAAACYMAYSALNGL